jgi:hypothetical protein
MDQTKFAKYVKQVIPAAGRVSNTGRGENMLYTGISSPTRMTIPALSGTMEIQILPGIKNKYNLITFFFREYMYN